MVHRPGPERLGELFRLGRHRQAQVVNLLEIRDVHDKPGLSCGRPLARNIFFTAAPFSASPKGRYTVSVGMPTTSPARMSSAAVFTAFSSVSGVKELFSCISTSIYGINGLFLPLW